jgi:hypothetical protein
MFVRPFALRPKASLLSGIGALIVVAVLATGCGAEAAVHSAPIQKTVKRALIPPIASMYASVVAFTLDSTMTQATSLLTQMKSPSRSELGITCAAAGELFEYQYTAFRQLYTPSYARRASAKGVAGYKLVLSSMDECANAADGNDAQAMGTASADFSKGLSEISQAQHTIAPWARAPR